MLLNAYDTTVGKPIAIGDHIKASIKTLALMDDLVRSPKKGVYFIDHENGGRLPLFMFPLSVQSHDKSFITVLDKRPFTNKQNVLINPAEYGQALTAAYVQQDMQENNFTTIIASRALCARGYARALSNRIGRQAGLDDQEKIELSVFLALFYICQTETNFDDYEFVALNVLRQALILDKSITYPLIQEMGFINELDKFIEFLSKRDAFFKLRSMTKKDFISLCSTVWFSSLSRHIMAAAIEHPPTMIGIVYATVVNKMYQKTTLGSQLDPKFNEALIVPFVRLINTTYPIG